MKIKIKAALLLAVLWAQPGIADTMVVRTSDGSVLKGSFLEKDAVFLSIRMEEGGDISLPLSEISAVNGQPPSVFFKKFRPALPDSLFEPLEISLKDGKARVGLKFLSAWNKTKLPNGYSFLGPEDDRRWEGFRVSVTLECPPPGAGEMTYPSVMKKVTDGGTKISSESYENIQGVRSLRTKEMRKGGQAALVLRQIRKAGEENCLIEITLSHAAPEKLTQLMAVALFEKVAASVK